MASSLEQSIKTLKPPQTAPYAQQWYGNYEDAINSVIVNGSYQTDHLHSFIGTLHTRPNIKGTVSDVGQWTVSANQAKTILLMQRGGGVIKSTITIHLEKNTLCRYRYLTES